MEVRGRSELLDEDVVCSSHRPGRLEVDVLCAELVRVGRDELLVELAGLLAGLELDDRGRSGSLCVEDDGTDEAEDRTWDVVVGTGEMVATAEVAMGVVTRGCVDVVAGLAGAVGVAGGWLVERTAAVLYAPERAAAAVAMLLPETDMWLSVAAADASSPVVSP